jgi:four helix bundle protein
VKSCTLRNSFQKEENVGITSQIKGAGISIPLNISEASSGSGEKDYSRLIEISSVPGFELETQVLIATAVHSGNDALRISNFPYS